MATAKAVKKAGPKRKKVEDVKGDGADLFKNIEHPAIDTLKPHPQNPNIGDIDAIIESIKENGLAQPIIVNRRKPLDNVIVGGHHTWMALRRMGRTDIPAVFIDVSPTRHLKLMLALNRTADRRTYDEAVLLDIMKSLPDITGTGYTELDFEDLSTRASEMAQEAMGNLSKAEEDRRRADEAIRASKSFGGVPFGEEDEALDDDDEVEEVGGVVTAKQRDMIAAQESELAGAFTLKEDMVFDAVGLWGIPKMRTDMLMTWEELPTNFETWAGSATKDWPDPDTWWLYNWGIDSASGMKDISKVIIAFYAHDEYFEDWWWQAKKYVTKVLNSGIKYIVMPDFSMHTVGEESRVLSLWSFYRSRWLARYFQECGLKLIPEVTWNAQDPDFLTKIILPTTPKNLPMLCLQVQTIDRTSEHHAAWVKQLQTVLDTLKPEALIVYHGKQAEDMFDDGTFKYDGHIKMMKARMYALGEKAAKRQRKTTI